MGVVEEDFGRSCFQVFRRLESRCRVTLPDCSDKASLGVEGHRRWHSSSTCCLKSTKGVCLCASVEVSDG